MNSGMYIINLRKQWHQDVHKRQACIINSVRKHQVLLFMWKALCCIPLTSASLMICTITSLQESSPVTVAPTVKDCCNAIQWFKEQRKDFTVLPSLPHLLLEHSWPNKNI